jgi:hypothetical protein
MPSSLTATIESLAQAFATAVIEAIRSASLEEIVAESGGRRGLRAQRGDEGQLPVPFRSRGARRQRRNSRALAKTASSIVAFVKAHPGSASEEIRSELSIPRSHWQRPVAMALASKKLRKKGEKRSTRYYAI